MNLQRTMSLIPRHKPKESESEEIRLFCSQPDSARKNEAKWIRWAEFVERMSETNSAYSLM
jgi:hypothetical protein